MKLNAGQIRAMLNEAETQETIYFGKCLVVVYKLKNGFCLVGVGACVDPENFDLEVGRQVAEGQVIDQLFKLEGYLLQQSLFQVEAQTDELYGGRFA